METMKKIVMITRGKTVKRKKYQTQRKLNKWKNCKIKRKSTEKIHIHNYRSIGLVHGRIRVSYQIKQNELGELFKNQAIYSLFLFPKTNKRNKKNAHMNSTQT